MEKMSQYYPESAEHFREIPDHVVEHLGEIAMGVTHTDMHPLQYHGFGPDTKINLLDPDLASEELDDSAIELAMQGQEKVARMMRLTSESLVQAHRELITEDVVFGDIEGESEQEKIERETAERDAIYKRALSLKIEQAIASKEREDTEKVIQDIESILLLKVFEGDESRSEIRELMRHGMAPEVLEAHKATRMLHNFEDEYRFKSTLRAYETLIGEANGVRFYNGKVQNGETQERVTAFKREDLLDLFAIMECIPPEKQQSYYERYRYNRSFDELYKRLNPEHESFSQDMLAAANTLLVEIDKPESMQYVLSCKEPLRAIRSAKKLGMDVSIVIDCFGKVRENGTFSREDVSLDTDSLDQAIELSSHFPKEIAQILNGRYLYDIPKKEDGSLDLDFAGLRRGLESLRNIPENARERLIGVLAIRSGDVEKLLETTNRLFEALERNGLEIDEVIDLVDSANWTFSDFIASLENTELSPDFILLRMRADPEIQQYYLDQLHGASGSLREVNRPTLESLPKLQQLLEHLGIDPDLGDKMLQSWTTYNAAARQNLREDEEANPHRMPSDKEMYPKFAMEQSKAVINNAASLEALISRGGIESAMALIETFGIYNFGRHKDGYLLDQLERWQSGQAAKHVVVEARTDWNSFTGSVAEFEDQTGEGVFVFEANSEADVSRVAVAVGRRERELGREPKVDKFIVHAHGNNQVMAMGVDGETIDLDDYRRSAQGRERLGNARVNNYRRHLGERFEVVLQSCSTLNTEGANSIARELSDQIDGTVHASPVTITRVVIKPNGDVVFRSNESAGGFDATEVNDGTIIPG